MVDLKSRSGCILFCLSVIACSTPRPTRVTPIAPASAYVAMGSSYAAGPDITTSADHPKNRCARSADNYAHILARKLNLHLIDVTCSGATTEHVIGPWKELQPQIEALTVDTKLVTVTIGGNDVGYFGMLWSASCTSVSVPATARGFKCPVPPAKADAWTKVDAGMRRIAAEVHRRSPAARLVFVDYLSVLPARGACANAPMSPDTARTITAVAQRLSHLTARVAAETQADVIKASAISARHNACSRDPWITGFPTNTSAPGFVPYHPNEKGMIAITEALMQRLAPRPGYSKKASPEERPQRRTCRLVFPFRHLRGDRAG